MTCRQRDYYIIAPIRRDYISDLTEGSQSVLEGGGGVMLDPPPKRSLCTRGRKGLAKVTVGMQAISDSALLPPHVRLCLDTRAYA